MSRGRAVHMTTAYRVVVTSTGPLMRRWSRMTVTGLENLPPSGATLLIANHDSYWDPIAIAVAASTRRQIRALAKSTIWKVPLIGRLMDSMGHIPVDRSASNEAAVSAAIDALRKGECIGVFPEATRSLGAPLRARSGAGRLVLAMPDAVIVCARVTGTTDVVRAPRRPRITVDFFRPAGGGLRAEETAAELMNRLLAELRDGAPHSIPGRRRTAAKFAKRLEEASPR